MLGHIQAKSLELINSSVQLSSHFGRLFQKLDKPDAKDRSQSPQTRQANLIHQEEDRGELLWASHPKGFDWSQSLPSFANHYSIYGCESSQLQAN